MVRYQNNFTTHPKNNVIPKKSYFSIIQIIFNIFNALQFVPVFVNVEYFRQRHEEPDGGNMYEHLVFVSIRVS